MYNKVIMVGNLTRDIELKYLPSGAAIAKSAIATSYSYKTANGEKKEEVCFLDFNIFNRSAEVANQYLRKGSKVLLEGRLVFEQWTAQDGTNRSKHALRVDNMKMLDSKSDSQNLGANQGGGYSQPQPQVQAPQNQYNNQSAPAQNSYAQGGMNSDNSHKIPEIDIDEDEIPF